MRLERPSAARGQVKTGWLDSRHTFSFGHFHDPQWMGFGPLRVINEDRVAPGAGFPPHRHANMEILSVVLDGGLAHRDSTGGGGTIRPGEVQWMSAGHGVEHSEFNASQDAPVHFLQIWIQPDRLNAEPAYAQIDASTLEAEADGWTLLASPSGAGGRIPLRQDARLARRALAEGEATSVRLDPARRTWLHVARGTVLRDGAAMDAGDAIGIVDEAGTLELAGGVGGADLLLFDLPR